MGGAAAMCVRWWGVPWGQKARVGRGVLCVHSISKFFTI